MKTLNFNETYTNNTDKDVICKIKYLNCFGMYQTKIEVLKPSQGIMLTSGLNRIYIYN